MRLPGTLRFFYVPEIFNTLQNAEEFVVIDAITPDLRAALLVPTFSRRSVEGLRPRIRAVGPAVRDRGGKEAKHFRRSVESYYFTSERRIRCWCSSLIAQGTQDPLGI